MADQEIVQMLESAQEDLKWFDVNLTKFISEFNNRFIAFRNKSVLDSDTDFDKLLSKLKAKEIDASNVFVRFVSKVKYIL